MTTIEPGGNPLATALHEAFDDLIDRDFVSVVMDEDDGAVEVQADEWTLHVSGWPVESAWVAIDDEPAGQQERLAALDAALAEDGVSALRDADHRLGGTLVAGLRSSQDPMSMALADVLAG